MIQIIEESFDTLREASEYGNKIAQKYSEVRDLSIINSIDGKFIILIKLVINCKYKSIEVFKLAKLRDNIIDLTQKNERWKFNYSIKLVGREIKCDMQERYESNFEFDLKRYKVGWEFSFLNDGVSLIKIIDKGMGIYKIKKTFYIDTDIRCCHTFEEYSGVDVVDSRFLYNHLIESYKQIGILFDTDSLEEFKYICKCVSKSVNDGDIEE